MQPYCLSEARSAFARLLRHHQANGWEPSPSDLTIPGSSRSARARLSIHRNSTAGPAAVLTHYNEPASASQQQQLSCAISHQQLSHSSTVHTGPNVTPLASHTVLSGLEQPAATADIQQLPAVCHKAPASQAAADHGSAQSPSDNTTLMPANTPQKQAIASVSTPGVATDALSSAEICHAAASENRQLLAQATGFSPEDLTVTSFINASNDPPEIATAAAAQQDPKLQSAVDHLEKNQMAVDHSSLPMMEEVVDLLSPVPSEAKVIKHSGDDLAPDADMKRRKLLPKVRRLNMQAMYAF